MFDWVLAAAETYNVPHKQLHTNTAQTTNHAGRYIPHPDVFVQLQHPASSLCAPTVAFNKYAAAMREQRGQTTLNRYTAPPNPTTNAQQEQQQRGNK